jgi:hypothetical protein
MSPFTFTLTLLLLATFGAVQTDNPTFWLLSGLPHLPSWSGDLCCDNALVRATGVKFTEWTSDDELRRTKHSSSNG